MVPATEADQYYKVSTCKFSTDRLLLLSAFLPPMTHVFKFAFENSVSHF
jgi:hypothetical protein